MPTLPRKLAVLRPLGIIFVGCILLALLYRRFHRDEDPPPAPAYRGDYVANTTQPVKGFLPLQEALETCQRRRWDVYAARDRPRKVYDFVLINTELDWLEVRLNELASEVDYFVVLEASTTFQEGSKPLYLQEDWSRFKPFHNKIIHHVVELTKANLPQGDTWEHERFIRNAMFDQALASQTGEKAPSKGDVLIVADIDEIPRPSTIKVLRNCAFPPRVTLRSQFYYYSFQWQHRGEQWAHPQATFYNGPTGTVRPDPDLRHGKADAELYNAAWHCSSCLPSLHDMVNKITSFSHKGWNQPFFTQQERLLQIVRQGLDLFDREGEIYDRIDNNPDVPHYLKKKEVKERFAYMLDRDPPDGNFQDSR